MITNEAINRAIDYILAHSNEPVTVDEIAAHCNFSKFYFSRLFKAETGESVYEFTKRIKLEQSAFRLKIEKNRSITDIGDAYGYSASNYSSAFKRHHAISPAVFRREIVQKSLKNPTFDVVAAGPEPLEVCQSKVTIEWLPDYHVVYERHKGSYKNLSCHWGAFQEKYKEYTTGDTLLIECAYDDPNITSTDSCLYDLCMTVPRDCGLANTCVLPGGKFAVYHFNGPVEEIYHAIQSVFTVWLPQSGCEIDERHGYDIYTSVDCETMRMGINLCIPLK